MILPLLFAWQRDSFSSATRYALLAKIYQYRIGETNGAKNFHKTFDVEKVYLLLPKYCKLYYWIML